MWFYYHTRELYIISTDRISDRDKQKHTCKTQREWREAAAEQTVDCWPEFSNRGANSLWCNVLQVVSCYTETWIQLFAISSHLSRVYSMLYSALSTMCCWFRLVKNRQRATHHHTLQHNTIMFNSFTVFTLLQLRCLPGDWWLLKLKSIIGTNCQQIGKCTNTTTTLEHSFATPPCIDLKTIGKYARLMFLHTFTKLN